MNLCGRANLSGSWFGLWRLGGGGHVVVWHHEVERRISVWHALHVIDTKFYAESLWIYNVDVLRTEDISLDVLYIYTY